MTKERSGLWVSDSQIRAFLTAEFIFAQRNAAYETLIYSFTGGIFKEALYVSM